MPSLVQIISIQGNKLIMSVRSKGETSFKGDFPPNFNFELAIMLSAYY